MSSKFNKIFNKCNWVEVRDDPGENIHVKFHVKINAANPCGNPRKNPREFIQ